MMRTIGHNISQALHEELERSATECSELKLQVQEYARQASRVQELLEIKDQEKAELLEQFRVLSNEKEQIDSNARQTISESANMRAQIAARDEVSFGTEFVVFNDIRCVPIRLSLHLDCSSLYVKL